MAAIRRKPTQIWQNSTKTSKAPKIYLIKTAFNRLRHQQPSQSSHQNNPFLHPSFRLPKTHKTNSQRSPSTTTRFLQEPSVTSSPLRNTDNPLHSPRPYLGTSQHCTHCSDAALIASIRLLHRDPAINTALRVRAQQQLLLDLSKRHVLRQEQKRAVTAERRPVRTRHRLKITSLNLDLSNSRDTAEFTHPSDAAATRPLPGE
ncbi:hypothetical protein Zmor_010004 [Zophobas morio]|uniref:Uncharacterized protein n=1 Tax=Zophobas morio TaxID=2755281 RepID=A0AA38MJ74_9CUCU|nr:hypothetical protein Zmor_010004 [Zophobas morio]